MKKLNLGCGPDIKKGYVNMDLVNLQGVDVFWDLNKSPWPFKDDTFDEVYCSHVLEHVDDLIKVMKEIKRVSKHGAVVVIRVPHFSCGVSYRDPTHKSFFLTLHSIILQINASMVICRSLISKKKNLTSPDFHLLFSTTSLIL